jgi:uncharacterized protein (TIGR02246 family)
MKVEELVAIEEIRSLKARYFRYMDTKDWEAFADLFTADATMDTSGEAGGGVIQGRSEIACFVRNAISEVTTVHHGHMPEITIISPTEATGIWAMEDMLRWPDNSPIRTLHGYGHYHDTYERVHDRWLIKTTKLTRLRLDVT